MLLVVEKGRDIGLVPSLVNKIGVKDGVVVKAINKNIHRCRLVVIKFGRQRLG